MHCLKTRAVLLLLLLLLLLCVVPTIASFVAAASAAAAVAVVALFCVDVVVEQSVLKFREDKEDPIPSSHYVPLEEYYWHKYPGYYCYCYCWKL